MKNVLIARLSSLGDIVLTQPIINAVHQQGDHVTLMVQEPYQDIAWLLSGVDHVITPNQDTGKVYDYLIDLHGTGRSARALQKIMANKKVRYKKYSLARRLLVRPFGRPVFWNKWSWLKAPQSVVNWYSQATKQIGYEVHSLIPRLNFDCINRSELLNQLYELGVKHNQPIALLAPGARWATKQWPIHHFIKLAVQLEKQNFQVILIGHQSEQSLGQQIVQAASKSILSLIGQTSITQASVLLSICKVLISNDSGPMHLGLAAGTKVVALFGPTVSEFGFMPNHHQCQVINLDLPCQPCSIHGSKRCPLEHHNCMEKISVEQVLQAVNTVVGKV